MKAWASTSEEEWVRQSRRIEYAIILPDLRNALSRATEKDRGPLRAMIHEIEAQTLKRSTST